MLLACFYLLNEDSKWLRMQNKKAITRPVTACYIDVKEQKLHLSVCPPNYQCIEGITEAPI